MANVWAIAFKEAAELPSEASIDAYRRRMDAYAHEPLPWHRRWRYEIGRMIAGRRPFAPHLDRDRWTIECRGKSARAA